MESNSPANVSMTLTVPLTAAVGNSTITIQATSNGAPAAKTQAFTLNVTLNPDFVLSANSLATVKSGASINETLNITAQDGFSGTVNLTCAPPQGSGNCTVSPSSITAYPANANVTLNTTGISAGSSSFTVTGSSAASTHSLTVPFNVSDYQLAVTPASGTAGQTATATLTITPLNGYTGNISLACDTSTLPGASCTFNPASPVNIGLSPLRVGMSFTIPSSAPNKTYSVAVNTQDVSGAPQHSTTLPLTIAGDFSITPVTPSITIQAGQQAQFALDVNSTNGTFNSSVSFICAGNPALSTCSLSPASVTLGNATSVITMSVATTSPTAALSFPGKWLSPYFALLLPICMFFGLPFGPRAQIGKKLLPRTIALIFLFLSMTLISCGGGGLVGNNSVTANRAHPLELTRLR
ncbi:MAG TPA: hypothetical protein VGF44_17275 [Terriglobales bacterium]